MRYIEIIVNEYFPPCSETQSITYTLMCSLTQITMMGAVYMTGVLEYLTAEMMELAGNAASTNKKKRITPRHVERTKT